MRPEGFYWVRWDGSLHWEVALFEARSWQRMGYDRPDDDEPTVIGDKIEPPEDW
jgi:hypothetical protein